MKEKFLAWLKQSALMNPLERRALVFLALIFLIAFLFFFRLAWVSPREERAKIASEMMNLIEERQTLLQKHPSSAPTASSGPSFSLKKAFEQVSASMRHSRLTLIESRFSPVEQEGTLSKQTVQLSLKGPFLSLGSFLDGLEGMSPPLVIREISIIVNESKMSHVSVE